MLRDLGAPLPGGLPTIVRLCDKISAATPQTAGFRLVPMNMMKCPPIESDWFMQLTPDDTTNEEKNPTLLFEESIGYQIRQTHRLFQRNLQRRIEPYGVTLGMWYFIRALWHEDGLTQKELSLRVGTMEPTTLSAIKTMIQIGLVKRTRNPDDNRKINVFLTERGRKLKDELLPFARQITADSFTGFSMRERQTLFSLLDLVQRNLRDSLGQVPGDERDPQPFKDATF